MKIGFISLFLFVSVFSFANAAVQKPVKIEHIYIPFGFDSNDNFEIVIEGVLPNLCHRSPMTKLKMDENKISIKMSSLFYDSNDVRCPSNPMPFIDLVSLGILKEGNYNIVVNENTEFQTEKQLQVVKETTNAPDEVIYANVEFIEIVPGTRKVKLKGTNPSDCFEFVEVKVFSNQIDTYSILPIVKKVKEDCSYEPTPFSYDLTVPKDINRRKVLLHVRSMRGKSVNFLYKNLNN